MVDESLIRTLSKVQQFIETGPYLLDYMEYHEDDQPCMVYKQFVISATAENEIQILIQPTMKLKEATAFIHSLLMIVDNVNVKMLES